MPPARPSPTSSDPSAGDDLPGAGQMSEAAPQAASPPQTHAVRGGEAAVGIGTALRRGDCALADSPRCSFRRFLFPSLIDVFWRCLEIFADGSMFKDVLVDHLSHPGGAGRLLRHRGRAGAADGAFARRRQVPVADPDVVSGHPRAVLGGVRHHLVSRRRVSHPLHHGDDDAAGVHLPGAGRAARHVEGPDGDGVQLPARRGQKCSG